MEWYWILLACLSGLAAAGLLDSVLTRRKNYVRNRAAEDAAPHAWLIGRQETLTAFRFGKQTMDKNGCCCVAAYNAGCLLSLGGTHSLPDTIRHFDTYLGYNLFGFLGGSPWAIRGYFRRRGYRTVYRGFLFRRRRGDVDAFLRSAPVCIVLFKHRGSAAMHYAAVRWDADAGRFRTCNADTCIDSFAGQLRLCGRTLIGIWAISPETERVK